MNGLKRLDQDMSGGVVPTKVLQLEAQNKKNETEYDRSEDEKAKREG